MRKEINSTSQLVTFQKTKAHSIILDFIQKVNFIESSNLPKSTQVNSVLAILSSINSISDSIFPLPDSQRYGNKAFKLVFDEIVNQHSSSSQDLSHYIQFSFGDPIRLDYGTGHELNFIAFLYGSLTDSDLSWVRHIFTVYLKVVRSIIARFKLEPAGSHGVWGLDDYFFIPYYWGSADLVRLQDPLITPSAITDTKIVSKMASTNLLFSAVQYVNDTKFGPFFEHSSVLYDISGVPTWTKVNSGLFKMYCKEVLLKFPVIQHLWFGELLPFEEVEA